MTLASLGLSEMVPKPAGTLASSTTLPFLSGRPFETLGSDRSWPSRLYSLIGNVVWPTM